MSQEDRNKPAPPRPDSMPEAPMVADSEVTRLQAALDQKEAEAKENYDRYLRAAADLDNFRKRTQRERTEAVRFGQEPLIRDLLPVVDDLERALTHAEGGGNGQPLVEGVGLVLRSVLDVLGKHGVSRIEAEGERFDPALHEAVAQVDRPNEQPNRVVDQHRPGYMLHDRLLRAAQVTVSGRSDREPEDPVENEGNDD